MTVKKMTSHMRGAFTVDAPRKRLRMWVGIPFIIGVNAATQPFTYNKQKEWILSDHPTKAAALSAAPMALVGGVLTAFPYTRWAGALMLGWGILNFGTGAMINRTQAAKDAINMTGGLAAARAVKILTG